MGNSYTVKKGDTLSGIAHAKGYKSWRDIYFSPDNQVFRAKRPNPDLIIPGDTLILPTTGPGQSAPPTTPGSTFNPSPVNPSKLKLFLTPDDLYRIDEITRGPAPRRGDAERDLERALKELGPAAKESNKIDDLAKKVKDHISVHVGDWTIEPDLKSIGQGLIDLLKKKK